MFDFLKNSSDEDVQKELIKQLTFSNALKILDSQYSHADSFLTVSEIQDAYKIIYDELSKDIGLKQSSPTKPYDIPMSDVLNKLEDKD